MRSQERSRTYQKDCLSVGLVMLWIPPVRAGCQMSGPPCSCCCTRDLILNRRIEGRMDGKPCCTVCEFALSMNIKRIPHLLRYFLHARSFVQSRNLTKLTFFIFYFYFLPFLQGAPVFLSQRLFSTSILTQGFMMTTVAI